MTTSPVARQEATGGRTGLILAAGFGSRLRGTAPENGLKPLTPVAGVPLIVRTLRSLERAGCARAVVVLGFRPDVLRASIEQAYAGTLDLTFVINHRFQLKNGVSVLAARPHLHDPFVLVMADHVLGDEVMELARRHAPPAGGATLLVDYKLDSIFDMQDATKVQVRDGRVVAIGKDLAHFDAVDTGVFVCTGGLLQALDEVYEQQGDAALSDGVRHLARTGAMLALDIGQGFWQDVDTPDMLAHAEAVLRARSGAASGADAGRSYTGR